MDMRLFKKRKRGGLLPMLLQFTKQNHVNKENEKEKTGKHTTVKSRKTGKSETRRIFDIVIKESEK